jgi:hypothetical protein
MVQLAQTMHLSCADNNTASKWTKMRFHMAHVAKVFCRVCPKQFLGLWYIRRKTCTYLAPILTLSPNGSKWDFIWPTSPSCFIGCVQNDFLSLWYVWCKSCTYVASRLALSPNRPKQATPWASSPQSTIGCMQNDFWAYGTFGTNHAPNLHWHYHCLKMDWNEIPHDQCHLGDPSGVSKMISEPLECLPQTVHLSCVRISTIPK